MQKLFFHGRSLFLLAGFLLFSGCGRQEEKPKQVTTNTATMDKTMGTSQASVVPNNNEHEHILTMPAAVGQEHEIPDKLPEPEYPIQMSQMPMESSDMSPEEPIKTPEMPVESTDVSKPQESEKSEKKTGIRLTSKKSNKVETKASKSIDFEVENKTGKTIYVTCFSYLKRRDFSRWKWEKSQVYSIEDDARVIIALEKIDDPQDRANVLGYLAVCDSRQEADDATYELLKEDEQIDLDQIDKLHGKKVVITVEKYGMKGEFLDFDFVDQDDENEGKTYPSLDFPVENRTGKPLFVTCFVYEKKAKGRWLVAVEDKDDVAIWRYDKTNIVKIMPDEQKMINVDTISVARDRDALEGYLALFDEDEEQLAQDSTYEALASNRKLILGALFRLKNKKIVLDVEKYGIDGDLIDFTIKPVRKIDFTKIIK